MVDFSASSAFGILLAFRDRRGPGDLLRPAHAAEHAPGGRRLRPRGRIGVVYLLVQNINVLDPTGIRIIAYQGASQAGILLENATGKISAFLPHAQSGVPGLHTS